MAANQSLFPLMLRLLGHLQLAAQQAGLKFIGPTRTLVA